MTRTKVTTKYQTTIPENVRKLLKVKPGEKVEWYVMKGMVVIDIPRKIENPVDFLTSQIRLDIDAVKLVKETREDFR